MADIALAEIMVCETSGVNNNCGLNCLTHFLYTKLKSGEAQRLFANDLQYQALLQTFQEYYSLETKLTLDDLKKLLDDFPSPFDREVVLAPVLRQHLAKILKRSERELYAEAPAAISEYLREGVIAGVSAPLINANKTFFENLKKRYDQELIRVKQRPIDSFERQHAVEQLIKNKIPKEKMTEEKILDQIIFNRENELVENLEKEAQDFWYKEGCNNYANYIGDLGKAIEISADHLTIICQHLNIGLEIYTPDSIARALNDEETGKHTHGAQLLPEGHYPWLMRVLNKGIHWEYEEPDRDIDKVFEHNRYYQTSTSENKFKVKGYIDSKTKDIIMATIMDKIDNLGPRPVTSATTTKTSTTSSGPQKPREEHIVKTVLPPVAKSSEQTHKSPTTTSTTSKQPTPKLRTPSPPRSTTPPTSRGLYPGARTPAPKLPEKSKREASPPRATGERTKEIPVGKPILAQSRALHHSGSSKSSVEPGPFAKKEYERIYNRFEKNWDKNKVVNDEQLHAATIAQLKIVLQNNKVKLEPEHEAWFKDNHTKTAHEGRKPPRF